MAFDKKVILSLIFSLGSFFLFGQKVNRAIEALNEKNFDKAENLFGDLLRKDSSDVAALIGYALTMQQDVKQNTYKAQLETAHRLLIRARNLYPSYSISDKAFLQANFQIAGTADLENFHSVLIDKAWTYSYLYTSSVSEINRFIREFSPYTNKGKEAFTKKLITLTYDSLMRAPTIQALQQFQKNYPRNEYTTRVNDKIELLRYDEALRSTDSPLIEKFIKEYPTSKNIKAVYLHLADVRFKSLEKNASKNSCLEFVNFFQLSAYADEPSLQEKITSVRNKIEEFDFADLGETEDTERLSEFLRTHKDGKYYALVVNRLFTIEYKEIEQSRNFYKLPGLVSTYPDHLFWATDSLLQRTIQESRKHTTNKLFSAFLDHILTEEKIPSSGSDLLTKTILRALPTSFNMDTACMSQIFTSAPQLSDNESLYKLLATNCWLEQFPEINIFHKYEALPADNTSNNLYAGYLEVTANGKTSGFFYNEANETVKMTSISRPGTQMKLFELIKSRYNIRSFSQPRIERLQKNGLVAKIYGWMATDESCCPYYEMEILYLLSNGAWVADRALYVEPRYESMPDSEDPITTYTIQAVINQY